VPDADRRLAAVMFTDLVGFTKLGQRDEEAALRLRREHQALARPLFVAHGGREVKTLGDGFLVEFPSALESVRCGVAIQEAVAAHNARSTPNPPITLRIGIHLGDVVGEGSDIVGDAVNVASRIEPLAEPGGICVSGPVFDQVRNKLPLPLEKLGARHLKNVEFPIDIYRVALREKDALPTRERDDRDPNLRLAVLPFANLSPDANDAYFADGLTDELISQVSRIPSLRVIARTSILRYRGSSKSIREVAQDLGVGLALEGSVRKAGHQVRITVQLVDARSEEPLWSSRFDRPLDDIFSIQDEIAGQVATSISGHLSKLGITTLVPFVHGSPDTANLEAYALFLQGRKLLSEKVSEETIRRALAAFEEATGIDPRFARAWVGIADCRMWLSTEGVLPLVESIRVAREDLEKALALNENLAEAHSTLAMLLVGEDEPAGAAREARRAMELNPSLADPYRSLAQIRASEGRIDEAVRLLEGAQRLDPVDINVLAFLGRAYMYAGRESDALAHWERTEPIVPFRTNSHRAEYYLGLRDFARAETALREMERTRPESVWTLTYRGMSAALQGDTALARRNIDRLTKRGEAGEMTEFFVGFIHYALGEQDEFVARMERAFRAHSLPLLELMYSRLFERARSDVRIREILRQQSEFQGPPSPDRPQGGTGLRTSK
jgi:adenylate cyclase